MITEEYAQTLMIKLIHFRNTHKTLNDEKSKVDLEKFEQQCFNRFKYIVHMHSERYKQFVNYEDLLQEGNLALIKAMKSYNPDKGLINLKKAMRKYSGKIIKQITPEILVDTFRKFNLHKGYNTFDLSGKKDSIPIDRLIKANYNQYIYLLKKLNAFHSKKDHYTFLSAIIRASRGSWFWWANRYIETRLKRSANAHSTIRYPMHYTKQFTPKRESFMPNIIDVNIQPPEMIEQKEIMATINQHIKQLDNKQNYIVKAYFGFESNNPKSISKICKELNIDRIDCVENLNKALAVLKNDFVRYGDELR